MAHELTIRADGFTEFVSANGKDAWHNLGQRATEALSSAEAMELAGLNWTVRKEHLYNSVGMPIDAYAIYRNDNDAFLGVVGSRFTPIQNSRQFTFVDDLLQAEQGKHFDTAGSLKEGRIVFCTVNLGSFSLWDSDRHESYLAFLNGHDGLTQTQVYLTSTRIVCANTMRMSLSDASSIIKLKHTKAIERKLDAAKAFFQGAMEDMSTLQERMETYASITVSEQIYEAFVEEMMPAKSTRSENIQALIRDSYELDIRTCKQYVGSKYTGTLYNVLNAVTEYVDHKRSVKGEDKLLSRATSALVGSGADFKDNTLKLLDKIAEQESTF